MKKSTIWIIATIMGLSFLGLLILQISYIEEMAKMKKEQFDESVYRSLYQVSRNLEMNETQRYLMKDVQQTERKAFKQDSVTVDGLDGTVRQSHQFAVAADDGTVYSSFELKTFAIKPANVPKAMILRTDKNSISEASKSLQGHTGTGVLCGYADLMMEKLIPVRRTSCRILAPYSFASLMISSLRSRLYVTLCLAPCYL